MDDTFVMQTPLLGLEIQKHMRKSITGKIKTGAKSKSGSVVKLTMLVLLSLTIYGLITFDYKDINLGEAVSSHPQ